MISYKKQPNYLEVQIELMGDFREEQIHSIINNASNYIYDVTVPVIVRADCRQLTTQFTTPDKKRISQHIEEAFHLHFTRIVFIYTEEQRQQISSGLLHRVNSFEQLKLNVVSGIDAANNWIAEEIDRYLSYEEIMENLRSRREITAATEVAEPIPPKPIKEIKPQDIFETDFRKMSSSHVVFTHPSSGSQWTPANPPKAEVPTVKAADTKQQSETAPLLNTYEESAPTENLLEEGIVTEECHNYHDFFFSHEDTQVAV